RQGRVALQTQPNDDSLRLGAIFPRGLPRMLWRRPPSEYGQICQARQAAGAVPSMRKESRGARESVRESGHLGKALLDASNDGGKELLLQHRLCRPEAVPNTIRLFASEFAWGKYLPF